MQLTLVVKQYFFHACNKIDNLQLRPDRHYTSIFALPWQCDIMEYSSMPGKLKKRKAFNELLNNSDIFIFQNLICFRLGQVVNTQTKILVHKYFIFVHY